MKNEYVKRNFPDQFNILITEERDGSFVGTVEELPHVSAFEDSYREAWEILVDAICTLKEMNDEEGICMTYRNRKLLDLAHTAPCFADFEHRCGGWEGCDPAHSDSLIFGRGHGHKSHDCFFASMCHESHMMLDTMERDEKFYAWLRAYVKTQNYLWENNLIKVAK